MNSSDHETDFEWIRGWILSFHLIDSVCFFPLIPSQNRAVNMEHMGLIDKKEQAQALFRLENIHSIMDIHLRGDGAALRKFRTDLLSTTPYPLKSKEKILITAAQKAMASHPYLRTVRDVRPHGHQHIPELEDTTIAKIETVLHFLAGLDATTITTEILREEAIKADFEVREANVVREATFVRPGDINVGLVLKDILDEPMDLQMISGLRLEEMVLGARHGGTQLFPMTTIQTNQMRTRDLVITGWLSADGSEGFQAGTFYKGSHLPGRESDANDFFWKFFRTDEELCAAAERFLDAPDGSHKALLMDS